MIFNENDLLRDKTELPKLPSANVWLKPEFDTKDQDLFTLKMVVFIGIRDFT